MTSTTRKILITDFVSFVLIVVLFRFDQVNHEYH